MLIFYLAIQITCRAIHRNFKEGDFDVGIKAPKKRRAVVTREKDELDRVQGQAVPRPRQKARHRLPEVLEVTEVASPDW